MGAYVQPQGVCSILQIAAAALQGGLQQRLYLAHKIKKHG